MTWLATSSWSRYPNGEPNRDYFVYQLLPEVEDWLYQNSIWPTNKYPGGYGYMDLMFKNRVDAMKFALAWL